MLDRTSSLRSDSPTAHSTRTVTSSNATSADTRNGGMHDGADLHPHAVEVHTVY